MRHTHLIMKDLMASRTSWVYTPRCYQPHDDYTLCIHTLPLWSQYRYTYLVSPGRDNYSPYYGCPFLPNCL